MGILPNKEFYQGYIYLRFSIIHYFIVKSWNPEQNKGTCLYFSLAECDSYRSNSEGIVFMSVQTCSDVVIMGGILQTSVITLCV